MSEASAHAPSDFIRDMVAADVAKKKHGGKVTTRFPPEPNGYLHMGHAKSICLNFGVASDQGGVCHLRMDDTNPATEDPEYVAAIQRDVKWLGFDWGEKMFYASGYYEQLFELGEKLIRLGRAYVCDLSEDAFAEYRGTISEHGKESPFRSRTVDENLDLFRRMRKGEFKDGACVLRAKIDMTSPNMKMRDPPLYRIKHAHHYRTGDAWCIYPLYDYAHCLSDSFEGITHSLCTMEFESARELYDWVIAATEVPWVPRQTEFARLNLSYTVLSKRKLLQLVEESHVAGWDDPRMPTIAGMRRRGYTPEAIRAFCGKIGVAKNLSTVDIALLEYTVREDLNPRSPRALAVLRPLKVVIENYGEGDVEEIDAAYWPDDATRKESRKVPFTREIFIDHDDFMEAPPKDFYRLSPGKSVRLWYAYVITCTGVVKDAGGNVVELRATYDKDSRGGGGKKVDGTVHWVSASCALDAEVRIYDRLFTTENPGVESGDFKIDLNPKSLTVLSAKVEPSLATANAGERFQFARIGYFVADDDSKPGHPVFNRTVALKDGWGKANARAAGPASIAPKEPPVSKRAAKDGRDPTAPPPSAAPLSPEAIRLRDTYAITADEARTLALEPGALGLFEGAVVAGAPAKAAAALCCNDVLGELRSRKLDAAPFVPSAIAELLALGAEGTISSKLTKDVLAAMFESGDGPRAIVEKKGIRQISDAGALEAIVDKVLAENADAVARYRAGNANVMGALVGLTMKASGGKANPKLMSDLVKKKLG